MSKALAVCLIIFACSVLLVGFAYTSNGPQKDSLLASLATANALLADYNDDRVIAGLEPSQKQALINEINREIDFLETDKQLIRTDVVYQEQLLSSHQQRLATIEDVDALSAMIRANNQKINNHQARVNQLENQVRQRQQQCRSLKNAAQKRNCDKQVANINASIRNINRAITRLNRRNIVLRSDIATVNTETRIIQESINQTEQVIAELTTAIDEHTDRVDDLNDLKDKLEEGDDGGGTFVEIKGCTDSIASNWDSSAMVDDGSCEYAFGCTDTGAINFDRSATTDDGSCIYEPEEIDDCLCGSEEDGDEENPLQETQTVTVNITEFGGPHDPVVGDDETGAVSGEVLRDLNPDDIYSAWPLTRGEDALGLPHTVECFSPDDPVGSAAGNSEVNKAFKDRYDVEISYTDESGVKRTVTAEIKDRGPQNPERWDASRGLWNELGLTDVLDGDPSDSNNKVDLEVRLVPKAGSCQPSGS